MTGPLRNTLLALIVSAVAIGTAPAASAGNGGDAFFGFLAGATIATILLNSNNNSRRRYSSRGRYPGRYQPGNSGRYSYVPAHCVHNVRTSRGVESRVDRKCVARER
ncbi:MAG: hypothetical protein ACE5FS_09995 [Paracoccaceae bacterium]